MTFKQVQTDDEATENDTLLFNKNKNLKQQSENNPESPGQNPDSSSSKWNRMTAAVKKRLKKDGLRLILLIVLNGLYLYFGGLIFYMLEQKPKVVVGETDHVKLLINTFKSLNHKTLDMENMTLTDMKKITSTLHRIHVDMSENESESWTVTSGVFFASTVVTTIGYGNMSPTTNSGRWFCVMYAVVGIPLTLMFLALVGKIISKYINNLWMFIMQKVKKHLNSDYEYDRVEEGTELRAPVWLAILFMILVTSIFAGVFMKMEKWSFTKSLYFIFVTFTTIGFGDIVPHNSNAIWFNVTFLYIGLASVSITINLLIANITLQYRRHKEKIKIVRKLEEELDDSDNDEDDDDVSNDDARVTSSQRRIHNNNDDVTEMSSLEQDRKRQSNKYAFEGESSQEEKKKLNNKERKYTGL